MEVGGAEVAGHEHEVDLDAAVSRLEDVLLALPDDRALPDLSTILDRAELSPEILRRDERVLKVIHEAVLARPFGDLDRVARTRTEVEFLTLEVEVLADRLADPSLPAEAVERAIARLADVRARLRELHEQL